MKTDGDDYRLLTPRTTEQRVKQMEIMVSLGKFTIGVDTGVIGGIVIGGSQFLEGGRSLWLIGLSFLCALFSQAAAFILVWMASIHIDPHFDAEHGDYKLIGGILIGSFLGTWLALCAMVIFAWVNFLL